MKQYCFCEACQQVWATEYGRGADSLVDTVMQTLHRDHYKLSPNCHNPHIRIVSPQIIYEALAEYLPDWAVEQMCQLLEIESPKTIEPGYKAAKGCLAGLFEDDDTPSETLIRRSRGHDE